ncbi:hypothetical protein NsoK4_01705 [Nitrosopumilus sp. K4]|nr:hypothetical protein NsoK4_01705 [Nitrosopumilus sp. K4]
MKIFSMLLSLVLAFAFLPASYAETTVDVIIEKTTYSYCEKLFYTIKVSEVTGDPAIIHIRDETGKGSSAIPIQISKLENPVPSLVPFEEEVFPLGKYYIDVEYAGTKQTAEFELVDSGNVCIPAWIKQLAYYWVTDQISDVSFADGIKFLIEKEFIIIPETKTESSSTETDIPDWVKINAGWWIEEKISDSDFAQALQYLIKKGIIVI